MRISIRSQTTDHLSFRSWTALALGLALLLGACGDEGDSASAAAGGQHAAGGAGGGGTGGGGGAGSGDADSADAAPDGPPPPPDTDLFVLRLNPDGTPDTTFGTAGVARIDLGPGSGSTRDTLWGLARDASNRALLFGARKADGSRTDADRVVVRLTTGGALDTGFATMGIHTLNLMTSAGAHLADNARHGMVQDDGKIVASGYVSFPTGVGTQSANRVVLLRLDGNGAPDNTFGMMGIVNSAPFVPADPVNTPWGMAEAYAAGYQSGKYITTGYGRAASSGAVDMVSFRYTSTGDLDTTWGTNGIVQLDIAGDNDRGRDLTVLGDERVVVVGSGSPVAMSIDAMVVVLRSNGALDTSFDSDGYKLYDFGRTDEAFYDSALSPDGSRVAAVGYRTGGTEDADATLLVLPVGSAGGIEVASAVPVSETDNDRFWGVAFDAAGKIYGAGFVTEGGDNRTVVARYNPDGTLDTTFGAGGFVITNVAVGTTEETARGVAVQSDGKVLVAGIIEHM